MFYLIVYLKMRLIGRKIRVPKEKYPTMIHSRDFAHPHIEYKFPYYYFVVVEKGVEFERQRFFRLSDLMYRIFDGITFELASEYELKNRVENCDFRRVLFKCQTELMRKLSDKWAKKYEKKIEEVLAENPYNDNLKEYKTIGEVPDIEAFFEFNGRRTRPCVSGYRPSHRIKDDYLTSGQHYYYGVLAVPPGGTATGLIKFITPEAYPHCLWIGKKIDITEGEHVIGTATVTKIYNSLLKQYDKDESL